MALIPEEIEALKRNGTLTPEQQWVKDNPSQVNSYKDAFDQNYMTRDPYMSGEAVDRQRSAEDFFRSRSVGARFDKVAEEILGPNLGPNGGIQSSLSYAGKDMLAQGMVAQVPGIENVTLPQAPQASEDNVLASFEDSLINGAPGDPSKTPFGQAGVQAGQDFRQNLIASQGMVAQVPTNPLDMTNAQATEAMAARGVVPTGEGSFGRPELMPQPLPANATPQIDFSRPSVPLTAPEAGAIREMETGQTVTRAIDGGSVTVPQSLAAQTFQDQAPQAPSNAPMSVEATQDAIQARFGAPTISGIQSAQEGRGMATDAQGRMVGVGRSMSAYEQASQARSDAAGLSPRGGVSDADRRAARGEGMSMEQATRLTGGDRDAARAMIERQKQGLGEFAEPKDTRTPEQIAQEQKENTLLDQQIERGKQPEATAFEKKQAERAGAVKAGTITQPQADEANKQDLLGKPPMGYATWSQYEADTGIDADGDGKVATKADASEAAEASPASTGAPTAGTVRGGYKFKGGDPSKKENWEKV